MRVPLLDLRPQLNALRDEIRAAVNEVIDSTCYVLGPVVERFEESVAEYVGTQYAVGVSSGTDALLAALMAIDVGPGDLILTTDYSFIAAAGAISRLNATPVFLDIDSATYNLDTRALADWVEREEMARRHVKAIVPVHLFGQCCEMEPILAIGEEYGIPVIEDAAQAIGARYPAATGDRMAGSMGTFGCFSFYPSKNLGGIGDGGMVVTNDAELAEKVRRLRNHGDRSKYDHPLIGGNFRLDPIQAAVLQVKLPYLDLWRKGRGEKARYYDSHLDVAGLVKPAVAYSRDHHTYNQYVVSVPERRDALAAFLGEAQIGHAVYYPIPLHQQECFRDLNSDAARLRNSRHAARHSIALPIYPELTEPMQDCVIEKVTQFYSLREEAGRSGSRPD